MDEPKELVVFRCSSCGDTFPAMIEEGREVQCPSCGSVDVEPAHEPLL